MPGHPARSSLVGLTAARMKISYEQECMSAQPSLHINQKGRHAYGSYAPSGSLPPIWGVIHLVLRVTSTWQGRGGVRRGERKGWSSLQRGPLYHSRVSGACGNWHCQTTDDGCKKKENPGSRTESFSKLTFRLYRFHRLSSYDVVTIKTLSFLNNYYISVTVLNVLYISFNSHNTWYDSIFHWTILRHSIGNLRKITELEGDKARIQPQAT